MSESRQLRPVYSIYSLYSPVYGLFVNVITVFCVIHMDTIHHSFLSFMSRVCGVTLYENAARAVNTVHGDEQCSTRNVLILILTRKNAHVLKEFVQFVECVSSMNFGSFIHISFTFLAG